MHSTDRTVLVTGATGRQGGAVAARLLAEGWRVRALTREADGVRARALAAAGAEVVTGDLDDTPSLQRAADGAWGVFSVHPGSYAGSAYEHDLDHEVRTAGKLAAAATAAGAGHIVHSSSVGVGTELEAQVPTLQRKARAEEHWYSSGLSATVLRPGAFMENTFDSFMQLQGGRLVSALGADDREPLIAADDIAAFAAIAFADAERHSGQRYVLAGDNPTQVEKAAMISRATGRQVPFVPIATEQLREADPTAAKLIELVKATPPVVDIPALRAIHPKLLTFEQWMAGIGGPVVEAYFARLDAEARADVE